MTLQQIRDVIVSADPTAQHYVSTADGLTYTVWAETQRSSFSGDDEHMGGWMFTIDRYTQTEFDPMCDALEQAMDGADISWRHTVNYEFDSQQIHHHWDCEGW